MVSDRQPAVSRSRIMKWWGWHMTDSLSRALHSLRAVPSTKLQRAGAIQNAMRLWSFPCRAKLLGLRQSPAAFPSAQATAGRGLTALSGCPKVCHLQNFMIFHPGGGLYLKIFFDSIFAPAVFLGCRPENFAGFSKHILRPVSGRFMSFETAGFTLISLV